MLRNEETTELAGLSPESLRFALEATRTGVWDWNVVTNKLVWSHQLQRLFGLEPGTFRNTYEHYVELLHPEDRDYVLGTVTTAMANREPYEVEHRVRHPDGTVRWMLGQGRAFYDEEGNLLRVSGVSSDVTDRVMARKALSEAVRVRDEFISLASHELKTPLTSLQLQTQVAERELRRENFSYFSPDRLGKFFKLLVRQHRQLNLLVDGMLDVSRISRGSLELNLADCDLGELCAEALAKLQPVLEEQGCTVELRTESGLRGNWDAFRLEQVLVNLLTNAGKYGRGEPVAIAAKREGDFAVVTVTDRGEGIAAEDLDRIFQLFERAHKDSNVSGLGLGLYLSRQIVERHRGTLTVASTPPYGSTFSLRLPLRT